VEKNAVWYNYSMGKKRRSRQFKNNSQVIDINEARAKRLEKRRAERAKEEEKMREAAKKKSRGNTAIRNQRQRRFLLIGLIVVCIIAAVTFSLGNVIKLKKEYREVQQQQEQLLQDKKKLETTLDNISDPENIEEQARNQLRMIKPGEVLYMFPDEITENEPEIEEQEDKE
jgi:cell division protein DivIC